MKVYTNMDRTVQEQIDAIQNGENIEYPDELMQIAIVSMDNQTGEIPRPGGRPELFRSAAVEPGNQPV